MFFSCEVPSSSKYPLASLHGSIHKIFKYLFDQSSANFFPYVTIAYPRLTNKINTIESFRMVY